MASKNESEAKFKTMFDYFDKMFPHNFIERLTGKKEEGKLMKDNSKIYFDNLIFQNPDLSTSSIKRLAFQK